MSYVVCLSPIAQIFQPHLQQELITTPSLIFEMRPVKINVQRPCGAITFTLGSPKAFTKRQSSDRCEENDILVPWLTGGEDGMQSIETEMYGTALMDVDLDLIGQMTELQHLEAIGGKKVKGQSLEAEFTSKLKVAMAHAKEMSDARVMRAVKRVWEHLQKQYALNKEQGLGSYAPSPAELLCQFVLRKEIEAKKQQTANITAMMNETHEEMANMPELSINL